MKSFLLSFLRSALGEGVGEEGAGWGDTSGRMN